MAMRGTVRLVLLESSLYLNQTYALIHILYKSMLLVHIDFNSVRARCRPCLLCCSSIWVLGRIVWSTSVRVKDAATMA